MIHGTKMIAFRVMALQTGMLVVSIILLMTVSRSLAMAILNGWGAILIANSVMLISMSCTKRGPVLAALQLFKYFIFCCLLFLSAYKMPQVWPQALMGVLFGQIAHTLSCYIGMDK